MKCKNCSDMNCPYRTTDAEKECEYSHVLGHEPLTFEQMKELQRMQLQHDWDALRNQATIAAMQAMVSDHQTIQRLVDILRERGDEKALGLEKVVAERSVAFSDALIEELKKD